MRTLENETGTLAIESSGTADRPSNLRQSETGESAGLITEVSLNLIKVNRGFGVPDESSGFLLFWAARRLLDVGAYEGEPQIFDTRASVSPSQEDDKMQVLAVFFGSPLLFRVLGAVGASLFASWIMGAGFRSSHHVRLQCDLALCPDKKGPDRGGDITGSSASTSPLVRL
jgi:hypothetical protein